MIFLGLLFPREEEETIAKKSRNGNVQNQVNAFQWSCIDGFYEAGEESICIVNALPVGTFPFKYKEIFLAGRRWVYKEHTNYEISSVNLPILKQWRRAQNCKRIISNIDDKNIIIYSAYLPYLKAIKKLNKSYQVTLIVPDIPEFYDYGQAGIIKSFLRKLNNRQINKCMSRVDKFVLLTEAMKEKLKVGNRPYVVVEGICAGKTGEVNRVPNTNKKVILYTGTLNRRFGIDVLLDAFCSIKNENYELWLCGGGDYETEILQTAKKDSRIRFWGYVTRDAVLKLQEQATVLVNPRQNKGEYTKYSFPSKTMEYLLSGVPVVAYKLSGIPDEYDMYLNYAKNDTSQALRDALIEVCEDTTGRYEFIAKEAVSFILSEKNAKVQAKKILDLIND